MRYCLIATVILAIGSGVAAAQPAAPPEGTLTVRGQGRVQVPPDHATLSAEVTTKGRSAVDATAAHRERATRAVNALRAMKKNGVEIEQSNFRLAEIRIPPGPATTRQAESEFQAVTAFELKIAKIESVDGSVTEIASTGLFQLRSIRFGIDDRSPGMKLARENAVADARERASSYATAAGVQLGVILSIDEGEFRSAREFAASAPLARNVQVIPPEALTLSAAITITWRIAGRP